MINRVTGFAYGISISFQTSDRHRRSLEIDEKHEEIFFILFQSTLWIIIASVNFSVIWMRELYEPRAKLQLNFPSTHQPKSLFFGPPFQARSGHCDPVTVTAASELAYKGTELNFVSQGTTECRLFSLPGWTVLFLSRDLPQRIKPCHLPAWPSLPAEDNPELSDNSANPDLLPLRPDSRRCSSDSIDPDGDRLRPFLPFSLLAIYHRQTLVILRAIWAPTWEAKIASRMISLNKTPSSRAAVNFWSNNMSFLSKLREKKTSLSSNEIEKRYRLLIKPE